MSRTSKVHNWLTSEKNKDNLDLKNEKEKIIREISSISKEDIFKSKQPKKLSFWERIKKVLF